ncbi:MAG: hypothetical protein HY870_22130 [Chloroflexi bacterium]|nr:hypothetical protein [Chloroflexota bacterium]
MKPIKTIGAALILSTIGIALMLVFVRHVTSAPTATRTYPGAAPCNTTLQACIDGSIAGDVIYILPGVYVQSFTLNKAVSLIGAGANTTTLKAPPNMRVLTVSGSINSSTIISGLTFMGGNVTGHGGAILINTPAQPLLHSLIISGNRATNNGGGVYFGSNVDTFQIVNSRFENNSADIGGGLYVYYNTVLLEVTDNRFISNSAQTYSTLFNSGGAIYLAGSGVILNSDFERNRGGNSGGAIRAGVTLDVRDSTFISNTSDIDGGAISAPNVTLVRSTFERNVGRNGGAVDATVSGKVDNSIFRNNRATNSGGAFVIYTLAMTDTQVISNAANSSGGGQAQFASVLRSRFERNAALTLNVGGLSIFNSGGVTETIFIGNRAQVGGSSTGGGGLHAYNTSLLRSRFEDNLTLGYGGGAELLGNTASVSATNFISNTGLYGGGLAVRLNSVTVNGGIFADNTATSSGGGLLVLGGFAITGTQFVGNHAQDEGGGLYRSFGANDGWLVNVLFARNTINSTQPYGAAVHLYHFYAANTTHIVNTTITDLTPNAKPAILMQGGLGFITNTIVTHHAIGIRTTSTPMAGTHNLFYATPIITQGANSLVNTFNADPGFVDPLSDDYHITPQSPAYNSGTPVAQVTRDFENHPRPIAGAYDLGFDEYKPPAPDAIAGAPVCVEPIGSVLSYTVSLANGGNLAATSVVFTHTLNPSATFQSFAPNRSASCQPTFPFDGTTATCALNDPLPPGENWLINFNVAPSSGSAITGTLAASIAELDDDESNNSIEFPVAAGCAADQPLEMFVVAPRFTRVQREFAVLVVYHNPSALNVPARVIVVDSALARFRWPNEPGPRGTFVQLLAVNPNPDGPAGIIPPGASGSVVLLAQPITSTPNVFIDVNVNLLKPGVINWDAMANAFRPNAIPDAVWNAIKANPPSHGATWTTAQYEAMLIQQAQYLRDLGTDTRDVDRLNAFFVGQLGNFGEVALRQQLGALGYGLPDPTRIRIDTNAQGDVIVTVGQIQRAFRPQRGGGWKGLPGDEAQLTQSAGAFTLREKDGVRLVFWPDGNLNYVEAPNTNRVTANYTGAQLTGFSNTRGDSVSFTYNPQGRLSAVTDAVGRVTTYVYDAPGDHLINIVKPEGTITYTHVISSNPLVNHAIASVTQPDGNSVQFQYDAQGRLIRRSVNGITEPITITRGAAGVFTLQDALGHTAIGYRADFGPLARSIDPLGQWSLVKFDDKGHVLELSHSSGAQIALTYDGRGNLSGVSDAAGRSVQFVYEPTFNQLTRFTDARAISTQLTYNGAGNLTQVKRADNTIESFAYNSAGDVTQRTNRRGRTITLTRDGKGSITRKDYVSGAYVLYGYDAHRNLTQTVQVSGTTRLTTTFTYDAFDRLTRVAYANGRYLNYTYDVLGRPIEIVDHAGFTLRYDYTSGRRLWHVRDGVNQPIVTYTYDTIGRMVRSDNANGTATTYAYDAAARVISLTHLGAGNSVLDQFAYVYDDQNRRTSVTTISGTTTYAYDAAGQLTSVGLPSGRSITYTYDVAANRVQVNDDGAITPYTTNAMSQYTSTGGITLTHDADGNLTARGSTTYHWDDNDNLIALNAPGESWTFEYDAFGNRLAATRNGARTEYLIDPTGPGGVFAEYNGGGALIARYVQGRGLVSRIDGGGAAFYGFDASGNAALLTDASGALINAYRYLPFGEIESSIEGVPNPFQFGGKWGMQRTGALTLARSRYYDATLGRFISEEPVRRAVFNAYHYAANDPINQIDYDGFETKSAGEIVSDPSNHVEATGHMLDFIDDAAHALNAKNLEGAYQQAKQWGMTADEYLNSGLLQKTQEQGQKLLSLSDDAAKLSGRLSTASSVLDWADVGFGGWDTYNKIQDYQVTGNLDTACDAFVSGSLSTAKAALITAKVPFAGAIVDGVYSVGENTLGKYVRENWDDVFAWYYTEDPGNVFGPGVLDRRDGRITQQRNSFDPNEMIGPLGYGTAGWLTEQTMLYTIRFENVPTATASAAEVLIQHTLDADLDPSSIRLYGAGFGDTHVFFETPQASLSEVIDVSAQYSVAVRLTAQVAPYSGQLTWLFKSIDPATGEEPLDSLLGFLPPNDATGRGEGYVIFSAQPRVDALTGAAFEQWARIFFDDNAPIDTNVYVNMLDKDAPSCVVNPLPAASPTSFSVAWTSSDVGSGVAYHDVYSSTNGGSWTLWQSAVTTTQAAFVGSKDSTYDFKCAATDNVGLRQAVPDQAQATTQATLSALYLPLLRR